MPLSRTYRPKTFADVTGQQHVTETLRREAEQDRIGHAYLFSGPRGVGKTTTARLFAKALLCENLKNGEPCNACDACTSIMKGGCIDVIEMDAASYTGVENVREGIVEHVRFSPARWKRKVYVIDEAHMLSTSAWNALLKTLEEPPSYAIFILATTELHKVPQTIISRCQRFEFKRVNPADMSARIKTLATEEGMDLEPNVLAQIVRVADGYVRDAESLLEQFASLGEKKITKDLAELILPVSRIPLAASLLRLCSEGNVAAVLQALRSALDEGVAPLPLFDDLLLVIRWLIRSEDPSEAALLKAGDEGQQAVHELIGTFQVQELSDAALLLIARRRDAKAGVDPVFALELALATMAAKRSSGSNSAQNDRAVSSAPDVPPQPVSKKEHDTRRPTSDTLTQAPPPAPKADPAPAMQMNELLIKWREVIRLVEQENRSLPFILKICQPETMRGNTVVIRFQYPFHREKIIEDLKSKRIVEQAFRTVFARDDLLIDGVVGETIGAADRPSTKDIVSKVLTAFGGTVAE